MTKRRPEYTLMKPDGCESAYEYDVLPRVGDVVIEGDVKYSVTEVRHVCLGVARFDKVAGRRSEYKASWPCIVVALLAVLLTSACGGLAAGNGSAELCFTPAAETYRSAFAAAAEEWNERAGTDLRTIAVDDGTCGRPLADPTARIVIDVGGVGEYEYMMRTYFDDSGPTHINVTSEDPPTGDLVRIGALHELGHFLRADNLHSSDVRDVMYPAVGPVKHLTDRDVAGVFHEP